MLDDCYNKVLLKNKEIIYCNNYKIINNKYNYDSGYYKSYGNISNVDDSTYPSISGFDLMSIYNDLSSFLSADEIIRIKRIYQASINLGLNVTANDIYMLAQKIVLERSNLSADKYQEQINISQKEEEKRLERERLEKEAQVKKIIDSFLQDITNKQVNDDFRGWVLPNGLLMSQYNETKETYTGDYPSRQDHSSLVSTFISGVEEYDKEAYETINALYEAYKQNYGIDANMLESFAVERLGWVQVSVCGTKTIAYRAERWQDRILRPFFVDYGFRYDINDNGRSYEMEFAHLYDHMDEIMQLGLQKKYSRSLKQ
ncbi:MAG: hypothetical protein PUA90_00175 [bacterium]|nr:hypothetical protein [bacterium]